MDVAFASSICPAGDAVPPHVAVSARVQGGVPKDVLLYSRDEVEYWRDFPQSRAGARRPTQPVPPSSPASEKLVMTTLPWGNSATMFSRPPMASM